MKTTAIESVIVASSDAPGMIAIVQVTQEDGESFALHLDEEATLGMIAALRRTLRSVDGIASDNKELH